MDLGVLNDRSRSHQGDDSKQQQQQEASSGIFFDTLAKGVDHARSYGLPQSQTPKCMYFHQQAGSGSSRGISTIGVVGCR
jgi:hypothetical protein